MSRTYHHLPYKHWPDAMKNSWRGNCWLWSEPKAWRNTFKHRRRRAELAHGLARLKHGGDPDNMTWPLDKKPWIYYW